uniref:Uncharacterized protein n=1 Tax=Oryza punctata TaxID=4537 RepID=A0A0E0K9Q5_ORYPU
MYGLPAQAQLGIRTILASCIPPLLLSSELITEIKYSVDGATIFSCNQIATREKSQKCTRCDAAHVASTRLVSSPMNFGGSRRVSTLLGSWPA